MKSKTTFKSIIAALLVITAPLDNLYSQTFIGEFKTIREIERVDNSIYFAADNGSNGKELWISHGSMNNTFMVKDIYKAYQGSNPSNLTSFNGELYFTANNNINGIELWKSDGTNEGTFMIKDINPKSESGYNSSMPRNLTILNQELYFTAIGDGSGFDLWKTDGTSNGTVKVYESEHYQITNLTAVGNNLFFVKSYYSNYKLYKLDGTSNQITEIPIDELRYISELNSLNNSLTFITHDEHKLKIRLYNYNTATEELILLKEYSHQQHQDIGNFTIVNDQLFFSIRKDYIETPETDALWKTDGTETGTIEVKSFGWDRDVSESYMQCFTAFNDLLYFRASNKTNAYLYKSDGSESGTTLVSEVSINKSIEPVVSNERLYFVCENDLLWESDGTTEGTFNKYNHINLFSSDEGRVLCNANDKLFFKESKKYVNEVTLWNTSPNPKIELTNKHATILNNDELTFESKIDSCTSTKFYIKNLGDKELSISKISITGSDFYLAGEIDQFILPGDTSTFDLIYFPSSERVSKNILKLYSSDDKEGIIKVNIYGNCNGIANEFNTDSLYSKKVLTPNGIDSNNPLMLDKNDILENSEIGSIVGLLSVTDHDNISFSLVEGLGDGNNSSFTISNNQLLSLECFDFESKSTYNIRIQAKSNLNNNVYEKAFVIEIININENNEYDKCSETNKNQMFALTDVAYLDEFNIIAIGDDGHILKSTDAGENWHQVNSGCRADLRKLQFVNSSTGYAIGRYGLLLKTENAGIDWFYIDIPKPDYFYPENLYFVNQDVGYLYGGSRRIHKTIDGGITWETFQVPNEDLSAAYFFNESKGLICGRYNTLLMTTDGGINWEFIDMDHLGWNINFIDIQFTDKTTGFIAGDDGEIFKSTDGGKNWTQVGSFTTDYAKDIYFIDQTTGYALGGWAGPDIYKTTNGGVSWVKEADLSYFHNIVSFDFNPSNTKGCAVGYGSSHGSSGPNGRTIVNMQNSNWQVHSSLQASDYKCAIYFNDSTISVFGTKNFRTTDGGLIWNQYIFPFNTSILESFKIDSCTAFTIDGSSIYKTTSEGINWSRCNLEISDPNPLRNIYFFDENIGFTFGWENTIYKTTDGGDNWTSIDFEQNITAIEDMFFLDSNNGFAVSTIPAEVFKTNDGGLTWISLNTYTSKLLNTITFLDEQNGIALGNDGFELITSDGGLSWEEVLTGTKLDFESVHFIDSLTGYAVSNNDGGSGKIFRSEDAGLSWSSYINSDEFYNVSAHNNKLVFVGENGTLYSILENTPPSIPGYINGLDYAPINTTCNYSIPQSFKAEYIWSVSGDNYIEYHQNIANITWSTPGEHKIEVYAYNSCGHSQTRELIVTIEDYPETKITGKDTVYSNAGEIYTGGNDLENRFSWDVRGDQNNDINNNTITIDWGDPGWGKIKLIETKIESGARGIDSLNVYILEEDITSVTVMELIENLLIYPNPSSDFVNIDLEKSQNELVRIRIYNLSGKIIKSSQFEPHQKIQMDIKDLPSGLYVLEICIGHSCTNLKVIKE